MSRPTGRSIIRTYMETTYDSILATARRLFLGGGYAATSMRAIAEACGIAKATIYHHFPDKERILLALLDESKGSQEKMLEAIRAQTEPRPRIETAVRENLRFLAGMSGVMQLARRELPAGRELVNERFGPAIKGFRLLLAEAIAEGGRAGLFRSIEPEKAAAVLMAMLQGSVAAAMLGDGRIPAPEAQAEAILDVFFNGLLA
jgi:AcrR family transcriptional regulator